MSGILIDSTNPNNVLAAIRAKVTWRNMVIRAAAGYVDGPVSQWPASGWAALGATGVKEVPITVAGAPKGAKVADCETGDLTPEAAVAWAHEQYDASTGYPAACIYVNRSNKPAVLSGLSAINLEPTPTHMPIVLWVATLDGTFVDLGGSDLRTQPGVAAVQYETDEQYGVDVSVLTALGESWLGLGAVPWQQEALSLATTIGTDTGQLAALLKANQ